MTIHTIAAWVSYPTNPQENERPGLNLWMADAHLSAAERLWSAGARRAPTVPVAMADFDTMAALGGIGRQSATVVSTWVMGAGSVGRGYRVTI
jgi:hypothetical protein